MTYADIALTHDMIEHAKAAIPDVRVNRTIASPIDTLSGILGELAFAQWLLGDWRKHNVRDTKGRSDFFGSIEVKTSAFPFSDTLNLLVREDYASKRKPACYVQVIIDTPNRKASTVEPGWISRISGWASSAEVDSAPLRDFGSKTGGRGGYRCHYIQIRNLRPMSEFPFKREP